MEAAGIEAGWAVTAGLVSTKPPAFQFYASDWAHSVSSMTLEERGAHITLLAWSWEHGEVPNDMKRLSAILGVHLGATRRVCVEVLKRWRLNDAGQWVNPRLEKVRAEQAAFIERQRANGRLGGRPRKTQTEPTRNPVVSKTGVSGNPNHNPDESSPISDLQSLDQNPDQEQRAERAPRPLVITDNPRALEKLAHLVLDDVESGVLSPEDVADELKRRAAQARIRYDGDRWRKALDSAEAQRARRRA